MGEWRDYAIIIAEVLSEWMGTRCEVEPQWPLYMKRFSLFSSLSNGWCISQKSFSSFSSRRFRLWLVAGWHKYPNQSTTIIKCVEQLVAAPEFTQHLDNLRRYTVFVSWLIYLKQQRNQLPIFFVFILFSAIMEASLDRHFADDEARELISSRVAWYLLASESSATQDIRYVLKQ